MHKVALHVDGVQYSGWESVEVIRAIDAVAGAFFLQVSDGRPTVQFAGVPAVLAVDDEPVIDGYVDEVSVSLRAKAHHLRVSGRDKTADLVDCSAILPGDGIEEATLQAVIDQVVAPFGIAVTYQDVPVVPLGKIRGQGNSAFDVIEQACRKVGVLPLPDGAGGLRIGSIGAVRAKSALRLGENVLSVEVMRAVKDQFSDYHVKAQMQGRFDLDPAVSAHPVGKASDVGVPRYRPLLLMGEGNMDAAIAQKRAEWEATVRAARAVNVSVQVVGWRQGGFDGALWDINQVVPVDFPHVGLNGDFLIRAVRYTISEAGTVSTLDLTRADAYVPKPEVPASDGDL